MLAPSRRLDSLEFFDRPDPCVVQVGSVNYRGSLDHWNASNYVSELNDLFDSSMDVARIWHSVDYDVTVELDDKPHMP